MYEETLEDFRRFLQHYRAVWNRSDPEGMMAMYAPDVRIRWSHPGNRVVDETFDEAARSWREAAGRYAGKNPVWHFEDVAVAPIGKDEAFVAFWVTFELDGKPGKTRAFFVEAFRRGVEGWKKTRSHVEYDLPLPSSRGAR